MFTGLPPSFEAEASNQEGQSCSKAAIVNISSTGGSIGRTMAGVIGLFPCVISKVK